MIGPIHKLTQGRSSLTLAIEQQHHKRNEKMQGEHKKAHKNMQKHLHVHLEVRGSKLRGFLHILANGSYRYIKLVQDEMASPTIAKVFQLHFTLDIPCSQFKLSIQWDFLWWKTGVWFSQAMAEKWMFISPSRCSEFYTVLYFMITSGLLTIQIWISVSISMQSKSVQLLS